MLNNNCKERPELDSILKKKLPFFYRYGLSIIFMAILIVIIYLSLNQNGLRKILLNIL